MPAAADHPGAVSNQLDADLMQGTVLGPFNPDHFGQYAVHTNPIGVLPKKHRPGKWRLRVNLSAP